jgi:hypothetical protein
MLFIGTGCYRLFGAGLIGTSLQQYIIVIV